MIIYYLNVSSKYIKSEKWFFKSFEEVDYFIKKYKKNINFLNEEMKEEWDFINKNSTIFGREDLFYLFFTCVTIDTDKCIKWKRLFKAPFYANLMEKLNHNRTR